MSGSGPTDPVTRSVGEPAEAPIAIGILTRNRWETAQRCLASLHGQAVAAGVPIVVLVNGSDDDSAARLRAAYPDVEVHESPTNLGCPAGRNRLTELCRAAWVVYVDDDGTVGPDFVTSVRAEVQAAPADRMVIAGNIIDVDLNPDATFTSGPDTRFSGGICAIRRADFLRLGGYPEEALRQGEEGVLSLKLHDAGLAIHRAGSVVLFHPLVHTAAKRRELLRPMIRHSLLTAVGYCPLWLLPVWIPWKAIINLRVAIALRAPRTYLAGLGDVARGAPQAWRARSPVSARTMLAGTSRFRRRSG